MGKKDKVYTKAVIGVAYTMAVAAGLYAAVKVGRRFQRLVEGRDDVAVIMSESHTRYRPASSSRPPAGR